jgi:hypothetical protein
MLEAILDLSQERHYSIKQLAELWGLDYETVRRLFEHEPGVIRVNSKGNRPGTRRYLCVRIPETVSRRVHQRLQKPAYE